jgi:hypothetical protein
MSACGLWIKENSAFQSAVRDPKSTIHLALPLFVFRVCADHAHHALEVDDLAVVAHLLD